MAAIPRQTGRALTALRASTRERHAALEIRLAIAHPDAGRAEYAAHIAALYGWLSAIDPSQCDCEEKLQWLREDIAVAQAGGFLPGPIAMAQPVDLGSDARRWGWAYVIEGSMLGGRFLLDRLGERLSPWPARYLVGYGSATGRRWRNFLDALERSLGSQARVAQAADGALEAFRSLDEWFDRTMPSPGGPSEK